MDSMAKSKQVCDKSRETLKFWNAAEEHGLAARHSLLNARSTGSLSLVSQTVNQQGLTQIWNSLVFINVD